MRNYRLKYTLEHVLNTQWNIGNLPLLWWVQHENAPSYPYPDCHTQFQFDPSSHAQLPGGNSRHLSRWRAVEHHLQIQTTGNSGTAPHWIHWAEQPDCSNVLRESTAQSNLTGRQRKFVWKERVNDEQRKSSVCLAIKAFSQILLKMVQWQRKFDFDHFCTNCHHINILWIIFLFFEQI